MTLEAFFSLHPKVAIAFSGGVDSAYLMYAAKKYAEEVKAYYVRTEFQPQFELDDARKLISDIEAEMKIIELSVLADETVKSNPPRRCYYCKNLIFGNIIRAAAADGFYEILDGTNASDDAGDRPGMEALKELKVFSPLRECGITKAEVRRLSREAGLFTWDKPAYACLATRIAAGVPIEAEALAAVEASEKYMAELGFSDFRVRTVGKTAKLQVRQEQLGLVTAKREELLNELKKYYESVTLDLEVRG